MVVLSGLVACGGQSRSLSPNTDRTDAQSTVASEVRTPVLRPKNANGARSDSLSDDASDDDTYDDTGESEHIRKGEIRPHPFDSLSDNALRQALEKHPASLGSLSIGRPNAGQLMNGVRPEEATLYHLVDPLHAFGTEETVHALCHVLSVVAKHHPGTPMVEIGHLSAKDGGPLHPHSSHQSGRDVDLGFYYRTPGTRWYAKATPATLDSERTWTLIRTLVTDTDVEMILLDQTLQQGIEQYALSVESDKSWVSNLFHRVDATPAIVRHSPGHATHLHLRFFNPIAQESARRLAPYLTAHHPLRASTRTVLHIARLGDTLALLAQRYHTTMAAIRQANRITGFQLVAGRTYKIPVEEHSDVQEPTRVPHRRVPSRGRSN